MAAAMLAYFDASQPTKAHGAAGRQRVLEEFSMERMLARYLEIYDSVVGPRRAVGA
jgi:glycosyltransferase involved in cell wall biosynthesis